MQTTDGGQQEVVFTEDNFKAQYYDEYTGEPLPNHLVRAAMIEEMSYFSEKTVWTAAKWSDMKGSENSSLVRMRCVLCNKGDAKEPDVRARLVACEVAKDKQSTFYACTHLLRPTRSSCPGTVHKECNTKNRWPWGLWI